MPKTKKQQKETPIRKNVKKTPHKKNQIPLKLKVLRDLNLCDSQMNFVREILWIEKMDKGNFKKLTSKIGFDESVNTFDFAVTAYGCDICQIECNQKNPIYTNADQQGVDICYQCVKKTFMKKMKPIKEIKPGPVYSLQKIYDYNHK